MDKQATSKPELNELPFSQMLGDPVRACVQAQAEAARATRRYLDTVALKRNEAGGLEAVVVSFRYQNNNRMLELSIPLITLVPIPHFSVDRLDIEFNALVNRRDESNLICSFASDGTQTNNEEEQSIVVQHHLKVKLHASQDHIPLGLSKLLNFLDETISMDKPTRPSEKADLRLNTEEIALFTQGKYSLYPIDPITPEALSWSSSDPLVASVSDQGVVTAHQKGEAYIFVETYEARGRCRIIVESDRSKLSQIISAIKQNSRTREDSRSGSAHSFIGSQRSSFVRTVRDLDGGYGLNLIKRKAVTEENLTYTTTSTGLKAFHVTHTQPAVARGQQPYIHDFELLTTIMSALHWRRHNGSIKLYTDTRGLNIYKAQNMSFI